MIIIQVLGLDQFVVGRYSREHAANLAQLYETEDNEIVFYSPNSMVFHKGVEQTSWQTLVIVRAEEKYEPLEDAVADYILKTLSLFSINVHIEFEYIHGHHCHDYVNPQYPRFLDAPERKARNTPSPSAKSRKRWKGTSPSKAMRNANAANTIITTMRKRKSSWAMPSPGSRKSSNKPRKTRNKEQQHDRI